MKDVKQQKHYFWKVSAIVLIVVVIVQFAIIYHRDDESKQGSQATVLGNILTVSGTQKEERTNSGQGGQSYISSCSSFQNSFSLPSPGKYQGVTLHYNGDTLTIKIPRA